MICFFDTNILLDLFLKESLSADFTQELFMYCEKGEVKAFISSASIYSCYYILRDRKKISKKDINLLLINLLKIVQIAPVSDSVFIKALSSNFSDMEDAFQHFTAVKIDHLDAIVTLDKKGFRTSIVSVLTPEMVIRRLNK